MRDIVKTPDGYVGQIWGKDGDNYIVKFGSDGPLKKFKKEQLRFAIDEYMEASGGVSFFTSNKRPKKRISLKGKKS